MRLTPFALLLFVPIAAAADKDELKKLEGTWEVTAVVGDGKEQPKGKLDKLTIKDGTLSGFGPDLKLATDATRKPKWLDLTFSREGTERTVNGIYELDGDELKLAIPMAPAKGSGKGFENKRPEDFDTAGKAVMVIKAKKAK
jgi:uncharacterized protein (TIGR03067 family)